ncbi:MAG: hypothetical protein QOD92_2550 [Acidimicrobiaceae bacterium]|jgi:GT2 family glycosyltransferase
MTQKTARRTATPLPRVPKLRVVVLNFNGGDLTLRCLRSVTESLDGDVAAEIVLVDNASTDGVAERVGREMPGVRVIRSESNLGFAGGNNLALADLDGVDLVALVNNDVTVPAGWLAPLVDALRSDRLLGAASPKMLFDGRYRTLELTTTAEPSRPADHRSRGIRLVDVTSGAGARATVRYERGFYEPEQDGPFIARWSMPNAALFVEVQDDTRRPTPVELLIDSESDKVVEAASGGQRTALAIKRGRQRYEVTLDGDPFDLINNVGTELVDDGYGADRGWLEPDHGQHDTPADVFAWSGGAVLLRADYLRDVGVFDERLFLYYEDLELSWRGRRRGWRYRYVPLSVVRHTHAATAGQNPSLALYFNERNRLLVLARHASWRSLARGVVRYVAVSASYFRRDIVAPTLRRARPSTGTMRTRVRAFGGFLLRAPGQVRDRGLTDRSAR